MKNLPALIESIPYQPEYCVPSHYQAYSLAELKKLVNTRFLEDIAVLEELVSGLGVSAKFTKIKYEYGTAVKMYLPGFTKFTVEPGDEANFEEGSTVFAVTWRDYDIDNFVVLCIPIDFDSFDRDRLCYHSKKAFIQLGDERFGLEATFTIEETHITLSILNAGDVKLYVRDADLAKLAIADQSVIEGAYEIKSPYTPYSEGGEDYQFAPMLKSILSPYLLADLNPFPFPVYCCYRIHDDALNPAISKSFWEVGVRFTCDPEFPLWDDYNQQWIPAGEIDRLKVSKPGKYEPTRLQRMVAKLPTLTEHDNLLNAGNDADLKNKQFVVFFKSVNNKDATYIPDQLFYNPVAFFTEERIPKVPRLSLEEAKKLTARSKVQTATLVSNVKQIAPKADSLDDMPF
jgi:hypothetical protein